MDLPIEHSLAVNGSALTVFEWSGTGTPLLFVHATGFHARCWDQVIAALPGRHCYAVDMRGHGRSAKPAPPYRWDAFASDLVELGDQLGLRGAIGIGHSMGGHSATLAAALQPSLFAKLLLLDPTILRPERYTEHALEEEHFAARRRNQWDSVEAMFDRFKDRAPFASWNRAVLRDYCEFGLLPAPAGDGLVLACPPAIEASIYQHGNVTNIYPHLASIEIPVQIVRAGRESTGLQDMSASPTAPDLVRHFRNAQDLCLPAHSHFIPMEAPELVAQWIRELE